MVVALRTASAPVEARAPKIETAYPSPGATELPVQPTVELERPYRKQRLAADCAMPPKTSMRWGTAHRRSRDRELGRMPGRFQLRPGPNQEIRSELHSPRSHTPRSRELAWLARKLPEQSRQVMAGARHGLVSR